MNVRRGLHASHGGLAMAELPLEGVGSCEIRPTLLSRLPSCRGQGLHRVALPRNTVRGLRPRPRQTPRALLRTSTTNAPACSVLPAVWDLKSFHILRHGNASQPTLACRTRSCSRRGRSLRG